MKVFFLLNLNEVFKGMVWMQNSVFCFILFLLGTSIQLIMRWRYVVSETSPQYVFQSEMSKSNT